jgi:hypothetical protein
MPAGKITVWNKLWIQTVGMLQGYGYFAFKARMALK